MSFCVAACWPAVGNERRVCFFCHKNRLTPVVGWGVEFEYFLLN